MNREGFRFRWAGLTHRRRMALVKRMVGYSVYVFVNNVGQKTSVAAGPIIIGIFLPVAAVTPYAIAGNLANYAKSLMISSSWAFNPLVSHYASLKDAVMLTQVIRRGAKLPLVVGLPVTIAYILVGDTFIGLWMGPQYVIEAAAVLTVLAFMETMSAPHHVMAAALYGMSKHQSLAFMRVGEAVANIVLSIGLIKVWGIVGVAIGGLVPHMILVLVLLPWVLGRQIGTSFLSLMRGVFVRPVLGSIPFAVVVYLVYETWPPTSLPAFFALMFLCLPVYGASILLISLDAVERAVVNDKMKAFLNRKRGPPHAEEDPVSRA